MKTGSSKNYGIKLKTLHKIFFLFFVLAFVGRSAFAEGSITVDSKVDRSTILIGDVFHYSVLVTHDPDVKIQSPSLGTNLGQFEIRDYKVLEPVKTDSQIVEQTNYTLSTFDTGEFEIPPLKIDFTTAADSTVKSIKTKPIKINVQSLNPDQAGDIRDIKPPIDPPKQYGQIILIAVIILGALLLALFVFYYLKRRKEGKSLIPRKEQPPRPAHEIALEALEKLVQSDLLAVGKVKEYYIELSDIIRQYIGNRYFIYAMEMTTSQLLDEMRNEGIDDEYIEMMREFLNNCDMVKFAKYIPSDDENQNTTQIAFDFVDKSKLVVVESEDEKQETDEVPEDVAVEAVGADEIAVDPPLETGGGDRNV